MSFSLPRLVRSPQAAIARGAALLALACVVSPSAWSASLGSNLIVNGDAEADVGSPNGDSAAAVTGFTTTGPFAVVTYGAAGGFPFPTDPGPSDRGLNFFAGGPSNAASSATQMIDLAFASGVINAGAGTYTLSAYLGGFSSQGDHATLTVSFLDSAQHVLMSDSIGPVSAADRQGFTGLLPKNSVGLVPVGARYAQVALNMDRLAGSYNDGYADNLSLVITSVPEPSSWALLMAGLVVVGAQRLRATRR